MIFTSFGLLLILPAFFDCGQAGTRRHIIVVSKFQAAIPNYAALVTAIQNEEASSPYGVTVVGHGSNIGSATPTSKISGERSGTLSLRGIKMLVTTLGNHEFDQGLTTLRSLLPAWYPSVVAANLGVSLPRVAPYFIQNVAPDLVIGYVGVLSAGDQSVMDQGIVAQLKPTDEVTALVNARQAAAAAGANFFIALLSSRITLPTQVDAYVAPYAGLFNVICLGLNANTAYTRTVNGTLVVSSLESGAGFVRVLVPDLTATQVTVPTTVSNTTDSFSSMEAGLWSNFATCKGSAKTARIDYAIKGRAVSRGTNGLRYCRISESPINVILMRGMLRLTNASIAFINTGAIRDDLPSAFVPDTVANLNRPSTSPTGPYDLASGDCDSVSPFGNTLFTQTATAAELYAIGLWAAQGDPSPIVAKNIQGSILGMKWEATYWPNLTVTLNSLKFSDGKVVDPTDTTTTRVVALTSFLVTGGDGFPVIKSSTPVAYNVTDRDILCTQLTTATTTLNWDALMPGDQIVTRIERVCNVNYNIEFQVGFNASISSAAFASLPPNTDGTKCLDMSLKWVPPQKLSVKDPSFTSVSSVLSRPNDYSIVERADGLTVGQINGFAMNFTLISNVTAYDGLPVQVTICVPEAASLPVFNSFPKRSLSIKRDNGPFVVYDLPFTVGSTQGSPMVFCANITAYVNRQLLVAPARTLDKSSSFTPVEQAFLFLFGFVYLAFTIYACVLLAHHIYLTRISSDLKPVQYINPAMIMRIELILIGICRFLYFVLLPWDTFSANVLGGYFLFEFPFILDFSVYSTFIQLFVTIFHWKKLRTVEKRSLWIPLLVVNILLFAFFFTVLIVYGVSTDPNVRSSIVLAYRITLASMAFITVVAFGIYGTVLFVRVHQASQRGNAPPWLAQMKRLTIVSVFATCGITAIFIVIVYSAVLSVPDPVLSSTPWLILFLFFAELLPLLAILHDLHRTAIMNQAAFLKSSDEGGSSVNAASPRSSDGPSSGPRVGPGRRSTISFKLASDSGGRSRSRTGITSKDRQSAKDDIMPASGEMLDIDEAFSAAEQASSMQSPSNFVNSGVSQSGVAPTPVADPRVDKPIAEDFTDVRPNIADLDSVFVASTVEI